MYEGHSRLNLTAINFFLSVFFFFGVWRENFHEVEGYNNKQKQENMRWGRSNDVCGREVIWYRCIFLNFDFLRGVFCEEREEW